VATTSPSSPPPAAPPPTPTVRAPRAGFGRLLPVGALALVILIVAFIVLGGGGGSNYKLEFTEANQLVRGDQVQVGGVPVGSITDIQLTKDFKALVTIHVDSSLTPLHEGTLAEVRVPSLSSVANRYIALSPGPNNKRALSAGATLPASVTKPVTDLDQLFNTLDKKTRKGLQGFIQGSAEQYAGVGKEFGASTEYFSPFLSGTDRFLSELGRDQSTFTSFLVETAKAVTTIGARAQPLSELVEHGNTAFRAIGDQQTAFAQGLRQLPGTLHQGNRTFENIPSTLSALETFFKTSKPATKPLTTLLDRLRPLLQTATPAVGNFAQAVNRAGANNDLTDLSRALPGAAKELSKASPSTVTGLRETVPITAFFGPYSPDLAGTLRTFGQAASYYDANGHYARGSLVLPDFKLGEENTLTPTTPEGALEGLKTLQLRRCPGAATQPAADGSSPFTDGELLSCDPLETP
jgi:phospholipid/cholesterol/gamma-HCH transport system substrate-binding protein